MEITVQLHGVFRRDRFAETRLTLPAAATPRQIVSQLGLSEALLGIVLVNGDHAGIDQPLQDQDRVALLPLLDGG